MGVGGQPPRRCPAVRAAPRRGPRPRRPSTRASRSAPTRAAKAVAPRDGVPRRRARTTRAAAASSVPDRTPRSCPPPCRTGVRSSPRRARSAPAPPGPPTLCPLTVIASSPDAPKSTGTWPTACTASACTGTPYRRASATTSSSGCRVPTSLFAHITEISATWSPLRSSSSRSASTSSTPSASTGSSTSSAPACSAIQNAGSSTAWCSTAETSRRRRRRSWFRRRPEHALDREVVGLRAARRPHDLARAVRRGPRRAARGPPRPPDGPRDRTRAGTRGCRCARAARRAPARPPGAWAWSPHGRDTRSSAPVYERRGHDP